MKNHLTRAFHKLMYSDSWENAVTSLGTAYASLTHHKMYSSSWLTYQELDDLYECDSLALRIVNQPVEAALKKGYLLEPPAEMDFERAQSEEKAIRDKLTALDGIEYLKKSLFWGRLYGRGGLLLGAIDGTTDPAEPLRAESVTDIVWLRDLRYQDFSWASTNYDRRSPDYGMPETWTVTVSTDNKITHTSRIILSGALPTNRERQEENDWRDLSLLQSIYQDLRNYDSAKTGIAQMLTDASQAVLKILNLPGILADDDTVLKARLRILEMARALHIMPINAGGDGTQEESFEYVERSFSGVGDAFDRIQGAVASSAGWPQTYFFGRAPAGENATGESDREIWDDMVLAVQKSEVQPPLQELVDLTVTALGLTEGWTVAFAPLRQMTDEQKALVQKTVAETDNIYVSAGVLDETTVALHRFGGDEPNMEPVQLSPEDAKAMQALQAMDRERALNPQEESEDNDRPEENDEDIDLDNPNDRDQIPGQDDPGFG